MSQLPPHLAGFRPTNTVILKDTPCRSCGYSLKGLSPGGHCPECGTLIAASRAFLEFALLPHAVLARLSTALWMFACAAALMICGALVSVLSFAFISTLPATIGPAIFCTGVALWVPACWLFTTPIHAAPSWINDRLPFAARWSSLSWVVTGISLLLAHLLASTAAPVAPAPPPPVVPPINLYSIVLVSAAFGISNLAFISIHAGRYADWAEDDTAARRLRWGWIPAVFPGFFILYYTVVSLLFAISFPLNPLSFLVVLGGGITCLCYFPIVSGAWNLASLCAWAIINSKEKSASIKRRARAHQERFKAPPADG